MKPEMNYGNSLQFAILQVQLISGGRRWGFKN